MCSSEVTKKPETIMALIKGKIPYLKILFLYFLKTDLANKRHLIVMTYNYFISWCAELFVYYTSISIVTCRARLLSLPLIGLGYPRCWNAPTTDSEFCAHHKERKLNDWRNYHVHNKYKKLLALSDYHSEHPELPKSEELINFEYGLTREFDEQYYAAKELHLRLVYESRYHFYRDKGHEERKDKLREKIGQDWEIDFKGYRYIGVPYDYVEEEPIEQQEVEGSIYVPYSDPTYLANSEDKEE